MPDISTAEGLNAALDALPGERVTAKQIEARIVAAHYTRLEPTVTVCSITLDNGYSVRGESACVDPANYNQQIGEKIAYEAAFRKLWPLFGFLLAEKRFRAKLSEAVPKHTDAKGPAMIPTIGRIVLYTLTSEDADAINRRREHARLHMSEHRAKSNGVMVHVGNGVKQGDQFPMVITRTWGSDPGNPVQGTVLLDGSDTFWATSKVVGDEAGMWRWPARA